MPRNPNRQESPDRQWMPTALEYEDLGPDRARIWVCVTFDGTEYKNVHLSGPKEDVRAYFEGRLTMAEIRSIWTASHSRTLIE